MLPLLHPHHPRPPHKVQYRYLASYTIRAFYLDSHRLIPHYQA